MEEMTSTIDYTLINSFTIKPYSISEKYGIQYNGTMPIGLESLELGDLKDLDEEEEDREKNLNLMNFQLPSSPYKINCPHDWNLREGSKHIPCFLCGFYPARV